MTNSLEKKMLLVDYDTDNSVEDFELVEDELDLVSETGFSSEDLADLNNHDRIYTARQRVEMLREDKRLQSEALDFDTYNYGIEDFDADFATEFSH